MARRYFGSDITITPYVDEGISGKETTKRANLNRMMNDVKSGKLYAVITYKVSRLSRSLSDSLKLVEEISRSRVRFISIKEGEYGTPSANLQFNILASVAQYQREELAENVQLGMTQRAKEGLWNGGKVLGYDNANKHLFVNPDEAETVRIIFDKYVNEGWGTKRIANFLNRLGRKTKTGKTFSIIAVSTILKNPVYKGFIRFNQVVNWERDRRKGSNPNLLIVPGSHEPIIDAAIWDKANERIERDATGIPRQYTGTFPLTGMAKCPECGGYMTSALGSKRKDGTKKRYYVCGNYHNKGRAVCNPNHIPADWLEQAVFERLSKALHSDKILKKLTDQINNQIKSQLEPKDKPDEFSLVNDRLKQLEQQKKKIQDAVALGSALFTEEEAIQRIREIRDEMARLEKSIEALHATIDKPLPISVEPLTIDILKEQLNDFFLLKEKLEPLELRKLLQASIEKIEATKNNLKHVHFSFIAYMPDLDPALGLIHNGFTSMPYIQKALYLPKKHYLLMIRFSPIDLHRAINLLGEHQAHELVGQRHAPERQPLLRAAEHRIGEPKAPADDEHDMARPVGAELIETTGQLLRAPELAANRERNDMRVALDLREDAFALALLHADELRLAHRLRRFLVGHLHDLKLHIRRQALRVFRNALHQIFFLQLADRHDLNQHLSSSSVIVLNSSPYIKKQRGPSPACRRPVRRPSFNCATQQHYTTKNRASWSHSWHFTGGSQSINLVCSKSTTSGASSNSSTNISMANST